MKPFLFGFLFSILTVIAGCHQQQAKQQSPATEAGEDPGWQLGVHAYTFHRFTLFEALEKADSCGVKYIEIFPGQVIGGGIEGTTDYHMDSATRGSILKMIADRGLTLIAYGVVTPRGDEEWQKLFEFGRAMGIHTFTSEPDIKDIPLISKLCDEYNINVAIHNHPSPRPYWHPDSVLAAIQGQSRRLGACADVGHWVRSGLDAVECLKKLEGHVLHLHMKDLAYRAGKDDGADDRDVHWGTGVVNINGVINELERQQFKGMLSAEYERNWENNVPDVIASVQYFRKFISEKQSP